MLTRRRGRCRDVLEAIRWHIAQGYAGPQFLFSQDGSTEVYAHLGSSAQLRLVEALEPASPPHRGQ